MVGDDELRRHRAVEAFLADEAALLDSWQLDDWLGLFTEDCRYVVPTTDLPEGTPEHDLVFIDDGFVQLRGRIERLKSRHAHREFPSSRTRRLISNIRIVGEAESEVHVEANFAVYRFRQGSTEPFVGRYVYHLVTNGNHLRIRYRRATLDNETLHAQGAVSIIL